jgi:mercuric ion transport protein
MTTNDATHECCTVPEPTAAPKGDQVQLRPTSKAVLDRTGSWSLAANSGAVLAAFLASACCVGPLVFALLGLGGAGLLLKFEPYRPYFMALTLTLLGTGFYFTYRKPSAAPVGSDGDACDCPAPRTNRVGRIMLWVATGLVLALLVFPYVAPLIWD